MLRAVDIAEVLAGALSDAAGWRFTITSSSGVSIGIDDSRLGGAYSPPVQSSEITGSVFIIWDDGTVSKGIVDSRTHTRLVRDVSLWRSLAYRDDDAAYIAPLAPPAQVEMWDPRVAAVVESHPRSAFEALAAVARTAQAEGVEYLDSRVRCSRGETVTATSNGLWANYSHTSAACGWELDKAFGMVRLGRDIETWRGLDTLVGHTAVLLRASRNRIQLSSADMPVILWPTVVDDLIDHYLLRNLDGEAVAEGRSRFSADQFNRGYQAFRSDMQLYLDSTRPMGPGSYPCTAEGVPAGRVQVADKGKLVSPFLNLKYARRTSMEPTPTPVPGLSPGHAGIRLILGSHAGISELLSGQDEALLVTDVLGMHTQDPVSGNFSLAVSDGLIVRRGKLEGATKAVISGNFFDALAAPGTLAACDPDYDNPALVVTCHVEA